MEQRDLDMKNLAYRSGITYESVRRFVRGIDTRSATALQKLCYALGLDYKLASSVAIVENLRRKYNPAELERCARAIREWQQHPKASVALWVDEPHSFPALFQSEKNLREPSADS
jgi:transcriptional regulator with XRE-family HTH domain